MYSVQAYGAMIADPVRMGAYRRALARAIGRESIVVDLGAGTGIFSLLACRLGARHVYAIEREDVIELARQIAVANGLGDRITFIQDDSRRVRLPVPADVIVSDLRGRLPLFGRNISTLIDARERMLASSGTLIPQRDSLWTTVVSAPQAYESIRSPWTGYGLDMRPALRLCLNRSRGVEFDETTRLAESAGWAELDYQSIDTTDIGADLELEIEQPGTAHGLLVGFDTDVFDGIGFGNGPSATDKSTQIYPPSFFPWLQPVDVAEGDRVDLKLQAALMEDQYVWRWNSRVLREGKVLADYHQSDFFAQTLSLDRLKRKELDHHPRLNREGLIRLRILTLMSGDRSLQEISRQLLAEYPDEFRSESEAVVRVARLSERFSA